MNRTTVLLCPSVSLCFGAWTRQNPLAHGHELSCASFPVSDTGYIAGDWGTIMRASESGRSAVRRALLAE